MSASARHPWWLSVALVLSCAAHAQSTSPAAPSAASAPEAPVAAEPAASAASAPQEIVNSDLDAPLFYQLLVGELELQNGQAGVAFQVLLDAARRSSDEELFRRVVGIALQGRAGDQALVAARAWRDTLPTSQEAHRTLVQLLALLNRPAEVAAPLRALLSMNAPEARGQLLASIPQLFQRSPEPKRVLDALEPLLRETAAKPETRFISLMVIARLAQTAGNAETALINVRTAAKEFPDRDEPLLLALELLPQRPEAEALITAELQAHPDKQSLRLAYGRALARAQRPADAAREFRILTQESPDNPGPWLALGSLELDLQHTEAAESALQRYMKLLAQQPGLQSRVDPTERDARQQGLLLLAQTAEMRGDLKTAEARLSEIDAAPGNLDIAYRRASLLARQGKLDQGRQLLQALPAEREQDQRAKVLAESQLLRDNRQWQAAYDLLGQVIERNGEDTDLLYEQSMMAEKLGRMKEMEALLQKVIRLKPQHYHAYNALGYALADRNERLEEARDLISKALTFAPGEPFIVDSMGWVEFRLGRLGEAERLLRQAYGSRPDPEIAAHLGEVLWAGGQQDEARRIFADAMKRDPRNEAIQSVLQRLQVRP
ncbi:tetratricopeptide repeat protein [Roseateles amylovorans]|uniref:Tetratricopeptide repeat protein n=1 Tax=Roseateles amylovorans TaxID=2978473 RepID=A0ABY6AW89_9BURK|nr:tetratricopeptide repeat protein [Roseateles amylovorans]UXH77444.1 tetratricopeptide repeat protein [Roseateles amylovorans]